MSRDHDLIEESIESQKIYDGRAIDVRRDTVRLPSGRIVKRDVIEHPGSVGIVPLLDEDTIVLVKQFRYPIRRVLLEIPAGTLKEGETPEDCAKRELIEETGYQAGQLIKLFECYLAPGYSNELMHIYCARDLVDVGQRAEIDEKIEIIKTNLDNTLSLIQRNIIRDAKTISGILTLFHQKETIL